MIEALNEKSGLSVKKQRYDTMLEQIQVRGSEVAGKLLQMKSEEEGWECRILEQEKKGGCPQSADRGAFQAGEGAGGGDSRDGKGA